MYQKLLHISSPSCFSVCSHHISLCMAIVFSLLSSASNDLIAPSFTSRISLSCMSRSSIYIHILPLYEFYSILLYRKGRFMYILPPPFDYVYTSYFFLAGPDPLSEITVHLFAESIGPRRYVFIPLPSLNPSYILTCSSSSIFCLSVFFSLISIISLTFVLYPRLHRWTLSLFGLLLSPSIRSRLFYPTLFQPAL